MKQQPKTATTESELHVILGAGQIGSRLSERLLAKGHRVRVIQRGPGSGVRPAKLEHVRGDMTDRGFAAEATAGAAVIYDCMNPAYHQWPELLLKLGGAGVYAATASGAKLIALDCLYMYGKPSGPMNEDHPLEPCSKKGELRVQLGELRLSAAKRGDLRLAIGRASDFFGPNLPYSCWNERFFQRLFAGKAGECLADPDMPHSYTFVDDIAKALVTLGEEEAALGKVWHLPTPPAESTRLLTQRLGRALGLEADVARLPRWVLHIIGLFSPFMREAKEMTYEWEVPFVIDDARFRKTFGYGATPIDEAVATTASWALSRFSSRSTASVAT